MSILPLSLYPDPILSRKAKKIKVAGISKVRKLIFDMLETLDKNDGLGLAAPQVGQSLQLSVMKYGGKTYVLINPKFISKSWKKDVGEEGCLSFPGLYIPVKRHWKVAVKALDRHGQEFSIRAEGMLARVLQHEIDHLNGILFTKRKAKVKKSKNS